MIRRATLHVYPGGHVELVVNPGLLAPMIDKFVAADDAGEYRPGRQRFPRLRRTA